MFFSLCLHSIEMLVSQIRYTHGLTKISVLQKRLCCLITPLQNLHFKKNTTSKNKHWAVTFAKIFWIKIADWDWEGLQCIYFTMVVASTTGLLKDFCEWIKIWLIIAMVYPSWQAEHLFSPPRCRLLKGNTVKVPHTSIFPSVPHPRSSSTTWSWSFRSRLLEPGALAYKHLHRVRKHLSSCSADKVICVKDTLICSTHYYYLSFKYLQPIFMSTYIFSPKYQFQITNQM